MSKSAANAQRLIASIDSAITTFFMIAPLARRRRRYRDGAILAKSPNPPTIPPDSSRLSLRHLCRKTTEKRAFDEEVAGCQPIRDRHPRLPRGHGAGAAHRGGLQL